jgi:hypothetical protein
MGIRPALVRAGRSLDRLRLLNYAKANDRPFSEVFQYCAKAGFLYRPSISPHDERLLLKSALLLTAWQAPISRPTMDIDLLRPNQ